MFRTSRSPRSGALSGAPGAAGGSSSSAPTAASVEVEGAAVMGLGLHDVTLVVDDGWGRTASCSTTVDVFDVTAPTLACPDDEGPIDPEALPAALPFSATDACGVHPSLPEVACIDAAEGEGCAAHVDGGDVVIDAVGAGATAVAWTLRVHDDEGNATEVSCEVSVSWPATGPGGDVDAGGDAGTSDPTPVSGGGCGAARTGDGALPAWAWLLGMLMWGLASLCLRLRAGRGSGRIPGLHSRPGPTP